MGKSYYLVTKPLQYFNATNIEDNREKILLLVDEFFEAEKFYFEIKKNTFWCNVIFFSNKLYYPSKKLKSYTNTLRAFDYLKETVNGDDYLYLDNDQSMRKNIWLSRIKTKNIYVYEEGSGSYVNNLSIEGSFRILKKILFRITGLKHHSGGSKYVKGIFLYDIPKHEKQVANFKNKRISFKSDFITHVNNISNHFDFQLNEMSACLDLCHKKKVILYLSAWHFDENIYSCISDKKDFVKILKLHPHVKQKDDYPKFDYVLSNGLLIELFIVKVLEVCDEITIYHHDSSALQYIHDSKLFEVVFSAN